jgi:hypothetical protein
MLDEQSTGQKDLSSDHRETRSCPLDHSWTKRLAIVGGIARKSGASERIRADPIVSHRIRHQLRVARAPKADSKPLPSGSCHSCQTNGASMSDRDAFECGDGGAKERTGGPVRFGGPVGDGIVGWSMHEKRQGSE